MAQRQLNEYEHMLIRRSIGNLIGRYEFKPTAAQRKDMTELYQEIMRGHLFVTPDMEADAIEAPGKDYGMETAFTVAGSILSGRIDS